MDKQKIDNLFRKKLHDVEVTPSANSWGMIEKQLKPRRAYKVYWIAASVTTVIATWLFLSPKNETTQSLALRTDHPQIAYIPEWKIPQMEVVDVPIQEAKPIAKKSIQPRTVVAQAATIEVEKEEVLPTPKELESSSIDKTAVAFDVEKETLETSIDTLSLDISTTAIAQEKKTAPKFGVLKITYKAAKKETIAVADSSGTFKKIWAFAGKISPGEMLASFKSAKDDFLNENLKIKNKEKRSL